MGGDRVWRNAVDSLKFPLCREKANSYHQRFAPSHASGNPPIAGRICEVSLSCRFLTDFVLGGQIRPDARLNESRNTEAKL